MIDKSWIREDDRTSTKYLRGVFEFVEFAFDRVSRDGTILCPCERCLNVHRQDRRAIIDHLLWNGFVRSYSDWILHGETLSNQRGEQSEQYEGPASDMRDMLFDTFGVSNTRVDIDDGVGCGDDYDDDGFVFLDDSEAETFYKLLEIAAQELYPGNKKYSKLYTVVRLFHIKCEGHWSNKSFSMLLEFLKELIPDGDNLPGSYYEVRKIIRDLGLDYEKIDACKNDCILYRKEHEKKTHCPICGASRYKEIECLSTGDSRHLHKIKKQVPCKVLRYFPLTPRLKRWFMSSKVSPLMRWHDEGRTKDGVLRHPADSPAWKTFDNKHGSFASESRNIRFGLTSDGFNPFGNMSLSYSIWPVVLIPYNLPPWLCMKPPNFLLSMIIPGPNQPGMKIDVYLQPLIEELKELWDVGVDTYDADRKEVFKLHAALLWTISDFPAYGYLSGWQTGGSGYFACPVCNKDTWSYRLPCSSKTCFMGHRRFLPLGHKFRKDCSSFDGKEEWRTAPKMLTGCQVLEKTNDPYNLPYAWKKKSIFFELPYWKDNLLRHNLDVMHIEKNVCESLIHTLLGMEKSKDHINSRYDLEKMGIRQRLHIVDDGLKKTIPPACFTMKKEEKERFCTFIKSIRVPDGYASNIARNSRPKERKLLQLKSHDYHVVMQQFLPMALHVALPNKNVRAVLTELSRFFKSLCSKEININDFEKLECTAALTICNMEVIFPPSFFDIMEHLVVHLAREARLAGPVFYHWMYPVERYLKTLKQYVRNKAAPEGSIAEGYLADECLTFCSRYLSEVETVFTRMSRNDIEEDNQQIDDEWSIFSRNGRSLGKRTAILLDDMILQNAHRYILSNCDAVEPFITEHVQYLKRTHPRAKQWEISNIHTKTFSGWFKDHIEEKARSESISKNLRLISRGPQAMAMQYHGYITNGFRFRTKEREIGLKTQNSGVMLKAQTESFASSKDKNPITGEVFYYGVLKDIIEISYYEELKVVLFNCDWVDTNRGVKKDDYDLTLVNFHQIQAHEDSFALASQVQQVYYVQDINDKDWSFVVQTTPRDTYDLEQKLPDNFIDGTCMFEDTNNDNWDEMLSDICNEIELVREDMDGEILS